MGLLGDALRPIGDKAPAAVILPLARAPQTRSTPRPSPLAAVKRFVFPELPETPESLPVDRSPQVVWPKNHDAETAAACAKLSEAMLRQLPPDRPRMVAFTSPGDGDGKTSLLMALAPQLAGRMAGSALAVDLNFRKPSLAARVQLPAGQPADSAPLIYPTNLPRLSFLAAPSERASRSLDPSWLEPLREAWSLVILDMASLAHAEVAPLAGYCDGVYLVVRLGYTSRCAVAQAARVIRGAGGRLLGCVVVG